MEFSKIQDNLYVKYSYVVLLQPCSSTSNHFWQLAVIAVHGTFDMEQELVQVEVDARSQFQEVGRLFWNFNLSDTLSHGRGLPTVLHKP